MAKGKSIRVVVGIGPNCPRCGQASQVVRHGQGKHAKDWGHCKNSACVTNVFPLNSRKLHLDRERVQQDGPACHRCSAPTAVWRHPADWKPTPGRGYYEFWYQCQNEACLTHQIMPAEAYVKNNTATN